MFSCNTNQMNLMATFLIGLFISFLIFLPTNSVFSKEISSKNIDNLTDKISAKFSKTFCNTSNFGISDKGAIEFAIGETSKQFSKNKLIQYVDTSDLNKKIISKIESECQVFDFPSEELANFDINTIKTK